MWTPKRVLLLASGLFLAVVAYSIYAHFMGSINGLPHLPPYLDEVKDPLQGPARTIVQSNEAEERLLQAFGATCDEVNRPLRLWIGKKRLALAAQDYRILSDGRLLLYSFSIAVFNKETSPNQFPEINTASSKRAYLEFDEKIKSLMDIKDRRIVAGELVGDIRIKNNRRTPQPDDDIIVRVVDVSAQVSLNDNSLAALKSAGVPEKVLAKLNPLKDRVFQSQEQLSAELSKTLTMEERNGYQVLILNHADDPDKLGHLHFSESKLLIWTDSDVTLEDLQSKPRPTRITATGLELKLSTETAVAAKPSPAGRKPKMDNVNGIESILLKSEVNMDFWIDSGNSFLTASGSKSQPRPAAPASPMLPETVASDKGATPNTGSKNQINIRTHGPFRYHVARELARFDIAPGPIPYANRVVVTRIQPMTEQEKRKFLDEVLRDFPSMAQESNRPLLAELAKDLPPAESRKVLEKLSQGLSADERQRLTDIFGTGLALSKFDSLECDCLELQFRRKQTGEGKSNSENRSADLEIESAHATGKEVVLRSDAEVLEAHGTDFTFDAQIRLSVLKGAPEMWALKEGNELHARELRMLDQKGAQQVTAIGPGTIQLFDRTNGKKPHRARWTDKLVTSKDGVFDLLILTGNAAIVDDPLLIIDRQEDLFNDQKLVMAKSLLKAETLKIWLEPGKPEETVTNRESALQGRRRPQRVEAIGRVLVKSPELTVHDADRFVVRFKNQPSGSKEQQTATNADGLWPKAASENKGLPARSESDALNSNLISHPVAGNQPQPAVNPPRPITLKARSAEVLMSRTDSKNELEKVWTEGGVQVTQKGASPDDKGVVIRGETLELTRKPEGNFLVVTGDMAWLQLNKLVIVGSTVNIDQATNKAWVNGTGAMEMESNAALGGDAKSQNLSANHATSSSKAAAPARGHQGRSDKPRKQDPRLLRIFWKGFMHFNGKEAEFHEDVQVEEVKPRIPASGSAETGPGGTASPEQVTGRLLCKTMQVSIDPPVSLKGKDRSAPASKVQNLLCDAGSQPVQIENYDWLGEQLVKWQRIEGRTVTFDNETGAMVSSGPGIVRILQRGSSEGNVPVASPAASRKIAARPRNDEQMKLTSVKFSHRMWANNKTRVAIFYGDVEIVNLPADNPNVKIDIDNLPLSGMYMRCDQLKVYTSQENGKNGQVMEAHCTNGQEVNVKAREKTYDFEALALTVSYDESKDQVIFDGGPNGTARVYRYTGSRGNPPQELKARKIMYNRRTGKFTIVDGTGIGN